MPHEVFLDTAGWLALLNATEPLHDEAKRVWGRLASRRTKVVLTDWIIAETGNGMARTVLRKTFRESLLRLISSEMADVAQVSRDLMLRGVDLYHNRPDKTWGLVDCVSFVVMEDNGIQEAFTPDRHFTQAGFTPLLAFD